MNSGSPASRLHYAWVIAAVTFLVLLVTAGIRATPGVLMVPLESEFGWTSAAISVAIAINLALFGLIGPFAASLMDRWGLRRIILCALALLAISVALTTFMRTQWQLTLLWGVCVGSGTGVTSIVLAAVIANRWFERQRGLVLGVLTAANATGQLLFLPVLARLLEISGWRSVALLVAASAAAVFVLVFALMRDRPAELGLARYGEVLAPATSKPAPSSLMPLQALALVRRSPAFWVLAGSFFVCGASTNGLIGTHLIPACHDFGIPEVRAAGLLAMMGVFDIIGTTISGWLSDRFSSRYLLFIYYALRGLSLLCLPYTLVQGSSELKWFAVFYGLDWVATVPPTVRLTADLFGRHNAGVVFGWIAAAHQLGAALAALGSGAIRTSFGDYRPAFWISGTICFLAGLSFLFTRRLLDQRGADAAARPMAPLPSAALGS
ncbi:MAG TPA: MFS transporter [Steroidobacteraceae bacterium]|jgi:sugar phosphate permease|nr:MFS transporter [Steroidobacteraceae bacterium]